MAKTRQDIEKDFLSLFKGVDNQAFPVKNLALRIFIFNLCHFQKKTYLWYTVNLFIFDNVICITLKVLFFAIFKKKIFMVHCEPFHF